MSGGAALRLGVRQTLGSSHLKIEMVLSNNCQFPIANCQFEACTLQKFQIGNWHWKSAMISAN
jgi:hypothetical protein